MTPSAKRSIINDYAREEALSAHQSRIRRLGLCIRQRLVQKVDFIANEQSVGDPTEPELKAFFKHPR